MKNDVELIAAFDIFLLLLLRLDFIEVALFTFEMTVMFYENYDYFECYHDTQYDTRKTYDDLECCCGDSECY